MRVNSSGLLVRTVAQHYMMPAETERYEAYGDLLMYAGLKQFQRFTGVGYNSEIRMMPDYAARMYLLRQKAVPPASAEENGQA